MTSWLASQIERPLTWARSASGRSAITIALISSTLTAFIILAGQDVHRRTTRKSLRDDVEARMLRDNSKRSEVTLTSYGTESLAEDADEEVIVDDTLIAEQLTRNIAFLGPEGMDKIRKSFVIIVGMGGVGSAAATMLARSGVGKLRLIDFDLVTLSSLNRHATATLADVGTPKVTTAKRFFRKIAPWIKVDARVTLFSLEDADELLSGSPDWILDCIDNITTKVQLLKYCHSHGLPVFSAMGAASKADPTRFCISDISYTFEDPLARAVRRRLRLDGISSGILVLYSTEKPNSQTALLPLPDEELQKGSVGELSALEAFRVRILPVLGPLPGIAGQAMAAHVLTTLGGFPTAPLPVKDRTKLYHRLWNGLSALEQKLTGETTISLSEEDIAYLFEDLHMGRSIVAPTFAHPTKPSVCRWRKEQPLTWSNVVVFERQEFERHRDQVLLGNKDPEDIWNRETCDLVKRRQEEELATRRWRL